jgi:hypothetical protein
MTRLKIALSTALLVTAVTFAYAQDPKPEPKAHPQPETQQPAEQNAPQPDSKPASKTKEMPSPRQDESKTPHQKQDEAKPGEAKSHEQQGQMQQGQMQQGQHRRRTGKSAHIPDEKFRASFGRQHKVVINRPVIIEGAPRFQYSGYWFEIVDPWPAEWLYTDDCYIDYVDGEYFLFDLLHPGVRIALFVVE